MFERADDYLSQKAKQLGMERGDQLAAIQQELEKLYPGQARAVSIDKGLLKIVTGNAAVASELRFRQVEIVRLLSGIADGTITKLWVRVG